VELLNNTARHDEEFEKLRLQKMKDDNLHRKQLMLMRVAGMQKFALKFKYFQDVQPIKKGKITFPELR